MQWGGEMVSNNTKGFLVAVDGPNGAGKSTLIELIKDEMVTIGYDVYITQEPTKTELGIFIRNFAEIHYGISLACMVAADRYEHIEKEILPELTKGKIVVTDRYVLSSLILQQMDGVNSNFIFEINSQIIMPDLQVAVFADEDILQDRLKKRDVVTRFEKENQSSCELVYMKKGIEELEKRDVRILRVDNNDNITDNVKKIVSYIIDNWRKL